MIVWYHIHQRLLHLFVHVRKLSCRKKLPSMRLAMQNPIVEHPLLRDTSLQRHLVIS
jgi:hypothetical protein